jgi:hypothetical protein
MPYPTDSLAKILSDVDTLAIQLKAFCTAQIARTAVGSVESSLVLGIWLRLRAARAQFVAAQNTAGIGAYAQTVKGGTVDVVAEFAAMIAAIDDAAGWITTNFPSDASGYLLARQFGTDALTDRQFAPVATAGLRSSLQGIVDAIGT